MKFRSSHGAARDGDEQIKVTEAVFTFVAIDSGHGPVHCRPDEPEGKPLHHGRTAVVLGVSRSLISAAVIEATKRSGTVNEDIPLSEWDADQYLKFEAERTRPSADLMARVPLTEARRCIDIGCGPEQHRARPWSLPGKRLSPASTTLPVCCPRRGNG